MDNASIHHVESNVNLIESMGAKVIFLPPYSPDLNLLEPVFGKVKAILKENDSIFQATSTPRILLAMAFTMVTQEDCQNFSKYCGYYWTIVTTNLNFGFQHVMHIKFCVTVMKVFISTIMTPIVIIDKTN